jgi:hypothetical protein
MELLSIFQLNVFVSNFIQFQRPPMVLPTNADFQAVPQVWTCPPSSKPTVLLAHQGLPSQQSPDPVDSVAEPVALLILVPENFQSNECHLTTNADFSSRSLRQWFLNCVSYLCFSIAGITDTNHQAQLVC